MGSLLAFPNVEVPHRGLLCAPNFRADLWLVYELAGAENDFLSYLAAHVLRQPCQLPGSLPQAPERSRSQDEPTHLCKGGRCQGHAPVHAAEPDQWRWGG